MLAALLLLLSFAGYVQAINTAAAAFYAADFGLDEATLARMFAWISLGAVGTLLLARAMDRVGRRKMLLLCVAGLSIAAAASAAAPGLETLITAQVAMGIFAGTVLAAGSVIISEELPTETRARGQAGNGIALHLGNGLALVGVALVAGLPGSWRWAWAFAVLPLVGLPWLQRVLPETGSFRRAAARGETEQGRMAELFHPRYRTRTLAVLISSALSNVTAFVTMTWLLYHPETALGMDPGVITAVVIIGGGVGLAGFPLGAIFSDWIGRRATVLLFGMTMTAANIAYYWVPPDFAPSPALGLTALFGLGSLSAAAVGVAYRTATTELFPTRLRGTLQGGSFMVSACSALATHSATAVLVDSIGGLVLAITLLALLGVPGLLIFYLFVPETSGLGLEESALD